MILPLVMMLFFTFSCQDKASMEELEGMKAKEETEEQNKKVFRYMIEETDKGNYAAWDEVCSPDYVCHFAGFPKPMSLEEHKLANKPFRVAFPDFKHTINNMVAEPGKLSARVTLTGTHQGVFMGIPPTGKKINYTAMLMVNFSGGKIVKLWGVADMLTIMQQLGMELKPKAEEKKK